MGGCCFTPRRSQFLWWYWLLLASIVGIPLLLACWYVARRSIASEEERRAVGRQAQWIFWAGAVISAGAVATAVFFAYRGQIELPVHPWSRPVDRALERGLSLWGIAAAYLASLAVLSSVGTGRGSLSTGMSGLLALLLMFLAAMVVPQIVMALLVGAVGGIGGVVLRRFPRTAGVGRAMGSAPWMCFCLAVTVASLDGLAELFWLMAVVAVVAHFWRGFVTDLTPRRARQALVAVVLGACAFWAVIRFTGGANLYLANLVRGRSPEAADVEHFLGANRR